MAGVYLLKSAIAFGDCSLSKVENVDQASIKELLAAVCLLCPGALIKSPRVSAFGDSECMPSLLTEAAAKRMLAHFRERQSSNPSASRIDQ